METIVELNNISKTFCKKSDQNNLILDKVSLSINSGELITIDGKNGSGKTTLLKIISGLYLQDSGNIKYSFKNYQKNISYLSTNYRSFFLRLSVIDNLKFYGALYQIDDLTIKERIYKLSNIFECEELLNKTVSSLSDGQKKRIMLVRCFLKAPKLVLCDEAYNSLDGNTKLIFQNHIENIIPNGISVVWISHEDDVFMNIKKRSFTLNNKKLNKK